jgi:Tol biopolymer transport system component
MRKLLSLFAVLAIISCSSVNESESVQEESIPEDSLQVMADQVDHRYSSETHIANLRKLTDGGENAEAYFSFDDRSIVYQYTNEAEGIACDQIYTARLSGDGTALEDRKRVSNGLGRTTCSFFMGGDSLVIYASTYKTSEDCPPVAERSKGRYVWSIYPSFELFIGTPDGREVLQLTNNEYYDAEAVISPAGDKILFTSTRNGDLDLYTMDIDGSNVTQITNALGYDGGGFFSPDGNKIIFRASRPMSQEEIDEYKTLLSQGLVAPTHMEVFVCNVDGSDLRQVTRLGGANWAPYFHPSGEKIVFSSNHHSERGFPFNIFMIDLDGTGLQQITFDDMFDSFPMFSRDGKRLIFSSNRNNGGTRETNLFLADWVE